MTIMAAVSVSDASVAAPAPVDSSTEAQPNRGRRIDPQSGRALEILGHSIEYLTDELVNRDGPPAAAEADIQAIQLLMGLNRQVYCACPLVPTLGERLRALLGLRKA